MATDTTFVGVKMPTTVVKKLKTIAHAEDRSVSSVVRRALNDVIERRTR